MSIVKNFLAGVAAFFLMAGTVQAETIKFAVTDINGLEELQVHYGAFVSVLEEITGDKVKFFPINNRTAAVEALANGHVDYVLTGPAEYIVFRARAKAVPVVAWQRLDYFTQLVVTNESPIKSLVDMKGKTIAFGEVGSTSTHLGPAQLLASIGLMPNKDYKAMNIHRNVSIEALLRGDVDAVAVGSSHLFNIRDKFTDVGLRVAARGPDLPNDVLVAGAHVPAANVAKMRDAFVNNAEKLLNAALRGEENKKYRGGKFIPTVKDFDYEYVRQAYITVGAESLAKFIDE
ncbi:MAG: PhnD/SsuA/transferrin family substrate-binding protein [Alphaproteobacteria bacterium]|nr:PhnD/SsuA/transferrin family substrate-binding protein [Alphaproteobacteria bacterium]